MKYDLCIMYESYSPIAYLYAYPDNILPITLLTTMLTSKQSLACTQRLYDHYEVHQTELKEVSIQLVKYSAHASIVY